ncbi:hypothetical protein [Streptomyces sp. NPDC002324]
MPTPITHKGHPVPYIAAWSDERLPQPRIVAAVRRSGLADGIAFEDSLNVNGFAAGRDTTGVLWKRWALCQGHGVPEFSVVHVHRGKRAMRNLLCQVCGGPSDVNQPGRLFLLEDERHVKGWPEGQVTVHPPLCLACAPVAARLCPHLEGNVVAVRADRINVNCVYGDVYANSGGPLPIRVATKQIVPLDDARLRWTLATQLAATLYDVTVGDLPELVEARKVASA